MYIDYCLLRNRLRKLGPWTKKSSKKPSSMADADIFCKNKLLLTDKPLMKTEPLQSQNSSSKPSFIADAEIFIVHILLLAQKLLTKTRTPGPKKSSKKPSSTADADIFCANTLLLTDKPLMKTESLVNPKIILETQLYGWIWNLQSTQATACSKIVNEN